MNQTSIQILTDRELMVKVHAIREYIVAESGLISRLGDTTPNAFYGATKSGLVLFNYYGGPSDVGTPFGAWSATGGGSISRTFDFNRLAERLGLTELHPEVQTSQGCYGAIYAITKDLDGNPLPPVVYDNIRYIDTVGPCSKSLIDDMSFDEIAELLVTYKIPFDWDEKSIPASKEVLRAVIPTDEVLHARLPTIAYNVLNKMFNNLKLTETANV